MAPQAWFFTDFGTSGPYPGLMEAALLARCPQARVIHLMHRAPAFDPRRASILLGALISWLPEGAVLVGVVDPGVGSERRALWLSWAQRHFIGPDNGLFAALLRREGLVARELLMDSAPRSASFHGRDLFAPAAGELLAGREPPSRCLAVDELVGHHWPDELAEVIHFDDYGNAFTGLRAATLPAGAVLAVAGHRCPPARTFSDVPPGQPFWYANSLGLAEVAVNRGCAEALPGMALGAEVKVLESSKEPE